MEDCGVHIVKIGRASIWRLKPCRSIAQTLEHEGKGAATGTWRAGDGQERAMPTPQPHQASWALRVSVSPSLAHQGSKSGVLEAVSEYCSGARARRERRCHWYVAHGRRPGARHVKATASPSFVGPPGEYLPTVSLAHHGSKSGVRRDGA